MLKDHSSMRATTDGRHVFIETAHSSTICPHIASLKSCPSDFFVDILNSTCSDCLTNKELWLCLVCLKLRCSRFNQRHMLEHFSDSGHCICLSVADLSVWCHGCNMYLNDDFFPKIKSFSVKIHELKFLERPPNDPKLKDATSLGILDTSKMTGVNLNQFFECPHVTQVSCSLNLSSIEFRCARCISEGYGEFGVDNNWFCLTCSEVSCGRDSSRHMLEHFNSTGHSVCLSFSDLSIWCYACGQYLDYNQYSSLKGAYKMVHLLKFPTVPVFPSSDDHAPCTHLSSIITDMTYYEEKVTGCDTPCAKCSLNEHGLDELFGITKQENWLCLGCCQVLCGRYDSRHMVQHANIAGHPLCMSFNDLSIWCFGCMRYLDFSSHPVLSELYSYLKRLKFPADTHPAKRKLNQMGADIQGRCSYVNE